MPITALYASLMVPLFLALAVRVIRARRGARVAVGDGGNSALMRRMRVHANFAEYVPLALLGGRLAHAFGMSQAEEPFAFRVAGIGTTFGVLGVAALACFHGALTRGTG